MQSCFLIDIIQQAAVPSFILIEVSIGCHVTGACSLGAARPLPFLVRQTPRESPLGCTSSIKIPNPSKWSFVNTELRLPQWREA
jgi:hypothetical protein